MLRAAIVALTLLAASCGSITPGAGTDGPRGTDGAASTDRGTTVDNRMPDGAAGGGLRFRGGVSTLGPGTATLDPGTAPRGALIVVRQGLRVPAAPVCNATLCFIGGITQ